MNSVDEAHLGFRGTLTHLLAAMALAWRASRWLLAARIATALVGGAIPVAAAWLTKVMLDLLTGRPAGVGEDHLLPVVVALSLATMAAALLPNLAEFLDAELSRTVQLAGRRELYGVIGQFEGLGRFEDPTFQDRLELAVSNGPATPAQLASNGLSMVQGAVTVTGFLGVLVGMAPWMAVVVALAALPTLRAELTLARRRAVAMWQLGHSTRRESFYAELITSVTAAKEVRLYGLGGLFGARMVAELRRVNRTNRGLDLQELRVQLALTALGAVVAGAGLVWAALAVQHGRLGVGDIIVFGAAVAGVQNMLGAIVSGIGRSHRALLNFRHYLYVMQAGPDLALPPGEGVSEVPPLGTALELRNVWFRYGPGLPWILRGVDLTIRAGEATALVGLNGAGKSTIVKLLCRFYDPDRGSVLWDGVDVRQFPVAKLRQRVGAVFQDFMEYELSAAENIGFGDLPRLQDRNAVSDAAVRAGCDTVVNALPRGFDTMLTRSYVSDDEEDHGDGVILSGGQWQRVALARALMRDECDLLVLDEPSAGLDAAAEHDVHTRLRAHRAGRTSLLISHRLSTVRDARTIVVLADGVVAERGDHDSLLAADGAYARLFRLQAAGYRDDPAADQAPLINR